MIIILATDKLCVMNVERNFVDRNDLVRSLTEKADACNKYANRLVASFGTDNEKVIFYQNKAIGYKMLADTIASDPKPFQFTLEDAELL